MLKKLRVVAGIVGLLSAASTFLGLRGFLHWLRQRPEFLAEYHTPAAGSTQRRDAWTTAPNTGLRGSQTIPATGPEESGWFASDARNRDQAARDVGRQMGEKILSGEALPLDSSTEGPTGATPTVVPAEIPRTGTTAPPDVEEMAVAMGVDAGVIETPATAPSQRGEPGTYEAEMTSSTETVAGIDAGPLDLPLVEALIAQDDLMAVIRERRAGVGRDPEPTPSSLTPVDRMRFQHAVDRLADAMARADATGIQPGSKEERAYRIIEKVRDALNRLEYTDEDLLRIDAEVRATACDALGSIQHVVDWDKAYTIYGCGQG